VAREDDFALPLAGEAARELIRRTPQVTRRKYPAEEKIRHLTYLPLPAPSSDQQQHPERFY